MENPHKKQSLFLNRIFCSIFGHRYIVTKKVTSFIKEYECACCHKQVTIDAKGNLATLTPQLREINETLEKLYRRKLESSQQSQQHIHEQSVA